MAKKSSENARRQRRPAVVLSVVSVLMGVFMGRFIRWQVPAALSSWGFGLQLLVVFGFMLAALYIHIVIHEVGHMLFGLATGYRFSSIRFGNFMIMKKDGRLVFKKLSLTGTGGQCLMVPPEMKDGKIPVMAYNLGGSVLNLVFAAVFMALHRLSAPDGFAALFCFMMMAAGLVSGLCNGIPMRTGTIDNDGYNAVSLAGNPEALRAFWTQMMISDGFSRGARLKEMPDEWFALPSDEAMNNKMVASIGVLRCNRLMDQRRFEEARQLIGYMLEPGRAIAGVHRNLLICDLMYLELIGEKRPGVLAELYSSEQKRFMKRSKTSPSVIRTEYVYTLLAENNEWQAGLAMERFEKAAKNYPYPSGILMERELMDIAVSAGNRAATQ